MGCASEHNVILNYERTLNITGGSGEIFIAKPNIIQVFRENHRGQKIIGDYWDAVTWDIVTDSNISDWIVNALSDELRHAGFNVGYVSDISETIDKGVSLSLIKFNISGNRKSILQSLDTNILLSMSIWKNGSMIKEYYIEGNGSNTGWTPNMSKKAGQSIEVAFKYCVNEMVTRVIGHFK